mmetsp:Transcript_20442/g.27555  ORF Transcript_20442/g.27555 Transcript_20442/m.27555 type:complete len:316 (+) Transcript_20442:40-987(+)
MSAMDARGALEATQRRLSSLMVSPTVPLRGSCGQSLSARARLWISTCGGDRTDLHKAWEPVSFQMQQRLQRPSRGSMAPSWMAVCLWCRWIPGHQETVMVLQRQALGGSVDRQARQLAKATLTAVSSGAACPQSRQRATCVFNSRRWAPSWTSTSGAGLTGAPWAWASASSTTTWALGGLTSASTRWTSTAGRCSSRMTTAVERRAPVVRGRAPWSQARGGGAEAPRRPQRHVPPPLAGALGPVVQHSFQQCLPRVGRIIVAIITAVAVIICLARIPHAKRWPLLSSCSLVSRGLDCHTIWLTTWVTNDSDFWNR